MLWVDIGITCGFTRKMEIAESHFQPLCTGLRRAGSFDRTMYDDVVPGISDSNSVLRDKWHRWARLESFRRLAYHIFEHDMRVATVLLRNPLTSFAEFTAPLPRSNVLWEASTAEAWRFAYLADVGNSSNESQQTSLQDLLGRPRLLDTMPSSVKCKSRSLLVHGLAGQIFEYRKATTIAGAAGTQCAASLTLSLKMRQDDL
jgi:hypothetical protein